MQGFLLCSFHTKLIILLKQLDMGRVTAQSRTASIPIITMQNSSAEINWGKRGKTMFLRDAEFQSVPKCKHMQSMTYCNMLKCYSFEIYCAKLGHGHQVQPISLTHFLILPLSLDLYPYSIACKSNEFKTTCLFDIAIEVLGIYFCLSRSSSMNIVCTSPKSLQQFHIPELAAAAIITTL